MSAATLAIYFQPRKQQRFHIHRAGFGSGLLLWGWKCPLAPEEPRGVFVLLQQRHKQLGGWSRGSNEPGESEPFPSCWSQRAKGTAQIPPRFRLGMVLLGRISPAQVGKHPHSQERPPQAFQEPQGARLVPTVPHFRMVAGGRIESVILLFPPGVHDARHEAARAEDESVLCSAAPLRSFLCLRDCHGLGVLPRFCPFGEIPAQWEMRDPRGLASPGAICSSC